MNDFRSTLDAVYTPAINIFSNASQMLLGATCSGMPFSIALTSSVFRNSSWFL